MCSFVYIRVKIETIDGLNNVYSFICKQNKITKYEIIWNAPYWSSTVYYRIHKTISIIAMASTHYSPLFRLGQWWNWQWLWWCQRWQKEEAKDGTTRGLRDMEEEEWFLMSFPFYLLKFILLVSTIWFVFDMSHI